MKVDGQVQFLTSRVADTPASQLDGIGPDLTVGQPSESEPHTGDRVIGIAGLNRTQGVAEQEPVGELTPPGL